MEEHIPHPVDIHVGGKIRIQRKTQGISQSALAETLGLTFQQIQKYERGSNRVSASKLFEIANTLQVSIGYFFEGLERTAAGVVSIQDESSLILELMSERHGAELAKAFVLMSPQQRLGLLNIARSIIDLSDPAERLPADLAA